MADSVFDSLGYRSNPNRSELHRFLGQLIDQFGETLLQRCPGFTDKNGVTRFWSSLGPGDPNDGYVVPYRDELGRITGIQLKRLGGSYETARLSQTQTIYHVAGTPLPGRDIYVTEGATKANVSHLLGDIVTIGLPGQSLSLEHVAMLQRLAPRRVIVALDQESNANTDRARERWLELLSKAGLKVCRAVWEGRDVGGPKGLDDLFQAGLDPRIRQHSALPSSLANRREVRQTAARGVTADGVAIEAAREMTRDAIESFVNGRVRR